MSIWRRWEIVDGVVWGREKKTEIQFYQFRAVIQLITKSFSGQIDSIKHCKSWEILAEKKIGSSPAFINYNKLTNRW